MNRKQDVRKYKGGFIPDEVKSLNPNGRKEEKLPSWQGTSDHRTMRTASQILGGTNDHQLRKKQQPPHRNLQKKTSRTPENYFPLGHQSKTSQQNFLPIKYTTSRTAHPQNEDNISCTNGQL